jgi:hypothetical protein
MKNNDQPTVLAQQNGWPMMFANGYSDGEASRKRQVPVPAYIRVAIDEYAEGFRAGYYDRQVVRPVPNAKISHAA